MITRKAVCSASARSEAISVGKSLADRYVTTTTATSAGSLMPRNLLTALAPRSSRVSLTGAAAEELVVPDLEAQQGPDPDFLVDTPAAVALEQLPDESTIEHRACERGLRSERVPRKRLEPVTKPRVQRDSESNLAPIDDAVGQVAQRHLLHEPFGRPLVHLQARRE